MARWIGLLSRVLACTFPAVPGVLAGPAVAACPGATSLDEPVERASARFAIPQALIRAVIAVESGGRVYAVSSMGAMGLMQLMPETWAELRLRYALGADPFDPCDNVLAGTAYLREMLDRYGDPGFLAAYNAGPGRYESYLGGTRPLPPETIAYVARISARTGRNDAPFFTRAAPDPDAWRRGGLFARTPISDAESASPSAGAGASGVKEVRVAAPSDPAADTLFVPRTGAPQ